MKQKFTLIITFLFFINVNAQINPSQTMNGKMIKAIDNKIDMNGGEVLNHLMINPNPNTTATKARKRYPFVKTIEPHNPRKN